MAFDAQRRWWRQHSPLRPPHARDETEFVDTCTRCDACVHACPPAIVVRGDGGFPVVDFQRGECTFCGACVAACTPQALSPAVKLQPWPYQARIGEGCLVHQGVACRSCDDVCGVDALRFQLQAGRPAMPVIDSDACNGCGACVAPCPMAAIHVGSPS